MATAQTELFAEPKIHKWTREEYYQMADIGLFFNQRVELIAGEVLDRYETPDLRLHLWTSDEYYKLAEAGFFNDKRVELIGGRIIEMSAQSRPHVNAVRRAARVLERAFGEGWFVQTQAPLDLDELDSHSQPEPDVAVIPGTEDDYYDTHPTMAALGLEVSFATLRYDRSAKAGLYAKAHINDYWILNLATRQLEVFRQPVEDAAAPFWHSYAEELVFQESELVSPLAKTEVVIAVADLLPPKSRKGML